MDPLKELQEMIQEESQLLVCQTHPLICELRDTNYPKLESMIIQQLTRGIPVSVQTALAEIEQELAHAQTS